jgi:hypothetical protein
MKNKSLQTDLLIAAFALLISIPGLDSVNLFDWDEINFAEAAREMIVTGDYLNVRVDFKPFHEKPPFYIWVQALSMKAFGTNEFAARFPNAIMAALTLVALYLIGKREFDEKTGIFWALAYAGSFLPNLYFRFGIIDPWFNFFMFISAWLVFLHQKGKFSGKNNFLLIIIAGLANSLAVLTKGPVGLLLVGLAWFGVWVFRRKELSFPIIEMLIFIILSLLPTIIWYWAIAGETGGNIIAEFINYQVRLLTTGDAGHSGPFYYHFVVIFLGCFPASIFLFYSFKLGNATFEQSLLRTWNWAILITVLVVFAIVKTKIVHYSSLAYFPVSFFAALGMKKLADRGERTGAGGIIFISLIGLVVTSILIAFPLVMKNINVMMDSIDDEFTRMILQTPVQWSGLESLIGAGYLAALVFGIIFLVRKKYYRSFALIFGSTAISMALIWSIIAPKIDPYTQGTPIQFYKSMQGEDVYVHTLGFKSYAQYFYQRREFENSSYAMEMTGTEYEEFLLDGEIEKPAYFVAKAVHYVNYTDGREDLKLTGIKNGWAFLKRMPEETK